jgi:hypothetical protein
MQQSEWIALDRACSWLATLLGTAAAARRPPAAGVGHTTISLGAAFCS